MKRLLVASVYAPSDRNPTWIGLQKRFLAETTDVVHDLIVYLNRADAGPFIDAGVAVAGRSDQPWPSMCHEHAAALNFLVAVFRQRLDEYEDFLLLDSDAFPCQPNWLGRLVTWMREDDFLPEKLFAAPCRGENLDHFPHPCVFFIRGRLLRNYPDAVDFSVGPHTNMAGYAFEDVGCQMPVRADNRHVWLPLLRSNVWNPHPILAAVYGGMFYHHGAGSRPLEIRSVTLRAYDNVIARFQHGDRERQLFAEIARNPKIFIRQLMGG
jgi:hypothetical protein